LQQVLEQGDPPADDRGDPPRTVAQVLEVRVPGERHEDVGRDEQAGGTQDDGHLEGWDWGESELLADLSVGGTRPTSGRRNFPGPAVYRQPINRKTPRRRNQDHSPRVRVLAGMGAGTLKTESGTCGRFSRQSLSGSPSDGPSAGCSPRSSCSWCPSPASSRSSGCRS